MALSMTTQEAVWLRRFLSDLTTAEDQKPTVVMEDNQGTIAIAKNPVAYARTKHIDIRYHYMSEAVQKGIMGLQYCLQKIWSLTSLPSHSQGDGLRLFAQ